MSAPHSLQLLDVCPRSTELDPADHGLRDLEVGCDVRLPVTALKSGPDLPDFAVRELGVRVGGSSSSRLEMGPVCVPLVPSSRRPFQVVRSVIGLLAVSMVHLWSEPRSAEHFGYHSVGVDLTSISRLRERDFPVAIPIGGLSERSPSDAPNTAAAMDLVDSFPSDDREPT